MGMTGEKAVSLSSSTQEILGLLEKAEHLFWAELTDTFSCGGVSQLRDSVVSLARIKTLQSSLGKASENGPMLAAHLLGWWFAKVLEILIPHSLMHR